MKQVPTRFAHFSRLPALAILLAAVALLIWGLIATPSLKQWGLGHQGIPDLDFYVDIVTRMRSGMSYYDSLQIELTKHGAVSRSMFNWRQPTLATAISAAPNPDWFYWLLLAFSLGSVLLTVQTFLGRCGIASQLAGTILLVGGAFSWTMADRLAYFSTEPWCETLILLSLCAYARGWWKAGLAAALAGLALRELMLPYCLAAALLAVREKRRTEFLLWIMGLTAYGLFLYWHAQQIAQHQPDASSASVADWLKFPGIRFVLESCVMNVFIRPLPTWAYAMYLPIALIGLAGFSGRIGTRLLLSAMVYVAAFMIVAGGDYWGFMYSPILVLGAVRSPQALRDLWRSVRGRTSPLAVGP